MEDDSSLKNLIPLKTQVILCDNLLPLIEAAVIDKDVEKLQNFYNIINSISPLTDKTDYDMFFDLGDYIYNTIDDLNHDRLDDGWREDGMKSLLEALAEAREQLSSNNRA